MPSVQQKFRLREATRLIKAARAAGLHIRRVETDDHGRPVLVTDEPPGGKGGEESEESETA
jgi:hypothetical protein